jgi:type I restriction enzyme S subunit
VESQLLSNKYILQQPRWDFRYFDPRYLEVEKQLNTGKYPVEPLASHIKQIVNFGAYSLCNLLVWVDDGIPYLRVTNLKEDGIVWSTVPHIPPDVHAQLPKSKVYPRDVLYSMAGTIGLAVVAPEDLGECNSNQAIAQIRLKDGIDPYYLAAFLNSKLGRYQSERIANGQTVLNINMGEIGRIRVPLPPRPIQDRIAQVMQEAYATRREKLAEAEAIEASINKYVLNQLGINWSEIEDVKRFTAPASGLRGSRFDVRYRSPRANHALALLEEGGYAVTTLENLIELIRYGASVKNDYSGAEIPFIRIGNLKPNQIDIDDIVYFPESMRDALGKAFVQAGDLLMSRSGSVGIVAVVTPEVDGFAFGSFQIKFRLRQGSANPFFIAYFLNSPVGNAQVEQQKTGSIQMNITTEGIKALRVPLPPTELQDAIVHEADARRAEVARLRAEAETIVAAAKARVERMILGQEGAG